MACDVGNSAAEDVQLGTVSYGVGCGSGIAGVYNSVQVDPSLSRAFQHSASFVLTLGEVVAHSKIMLCSKLYRAGLWSLYIVQKASIAWMARLEEGRGSPSWNMLPDLGMISTSTSRRRGTDSAVALEF